MCWNRLDKLRFVKAALGTFTWSKFHFLRVTKAQGGTRCTHNRGRGFDVFFGLKIYTLEIFFWTKDLSFIFWVRVPYPRDRKLLKKEYGAPLFYFFGMFWAGNWYMPFCIASLRLITSYVGKFWARTSLMQSGSAQCTILHFSCAPLIRLTDNNFSGSKTIITEDWVEMM